MATDVVDDDTWDGDDDDAYDDYDAVSD